MEEMQRLLHRALERVEALEARLEKQEHGSAEKETQRLGIILFGKSSEVRRFLRQEPGSEPLESAQFIQHIRNQFKII